jgi:hypothetical protein
MDDRMRKRWKTIFFTSSEDYQTRRTRVRLCSIVEVERR